ncbi:MAG TPA: hypothetical protein VK661_05050 [Planctomycetota bacterium]|nr:hypothetical protein [Planctomycetota bacterium]
MDAAGKVIANLEGERSVAGFQAMMTSGKTFADLKAKAEKGDNAAKVEYFPKALRLGHFKLAEARKYLAGLKDVPVEGRKEIDGLFAGLEMKDILAPLYENRDQSKRKELQVAAGRKFWEMDKAGRIPSEEDDVRDFYALIVIAAEEDKNIPAFEKGLAQLKERFGDKVKRFTDAKEEALEKLKAEKGGEKEPK